MVAYTEADKRSARRYVSQLLEGDELSSNSFIDGFSLLDVQTHALQFRIDLYALELVKGNYPAAMLGDGLLVPVALMDLLGPGRPYSGKDWFDDLYDLTHAQREDPFPLQLIDPQQAIEAFRHGATEFLAARLAAVRGWSDSWGLRPPQSSLTVAAYRGGPSKSVPGCSFSVSTNSSNLTVYWSGAYYLSSNYFGHPTSPATSTLQSGTYVFGVNGGRYGQTVHWDTQSVCALPGMPSVHLNY